MYSVPADIKDIVRNYDLTNDEGFRMCLFEALSNALYCSRNNETIIINIKFTRQYTANDIREDKDNYIKSFSITDNGVGFTDENYEKFTSVIYKTNHEGGKGLGRMAFLKVFKDVHINSVFREGENVFSRDFKFSVDKEPEDNKKQESNELPTQTTIRFDEIKSDFLENTKQSMEKYRDEILEYFYIFLYFLRGNNKTFEIKLIDDCGAISETRINTQQLNLDKVSEESFSLKGPVDLKGIDYFENFEILHIKTKNLKDNNAYYVVDERSAGEIKKLNLPPASLEDETGFVYHYHLYLKSTYFNRFLNESRTTLSIPSDGKKANVNVITEEKIAAELNSRIEKFLSYEIGILNKRNEEKIKATLGDSENNITSNASAYMYILNDDSAKKELLSEIKYTETAKNILTKVRVFHEELQRKTVNQINELIEKIKKHSKDMDLDKLREEIDNLSKKVNMENSVNLSSYIMYRKYVLNLFGEALDIYKNNSTQNEALFHNLLLHRGAVNSTDSNLWLLDEMFLYFDGVSEKSIANIKLNGTKIIRDLSEEEKEQLNAFHSKRLDRRVDLLFFPEEKKCVIIELKDPKIGITENVQQMDKYAELLANFTKPEYKPDNYYTYLITDNFNKYDKPTGYKKIYGIEGFARNSIDIKSYDNDAAIANQYSEIIKYSDIYKRASMRNRIFFKKLNLN